MFLLGAVALILILFSLWYLYQTVRIIWQYSSLLAIASVFFNPLIQIVFFLIPKKNFDTEEAKVFKKYFASVAVFFLVGVAASVFIPSVFDQDESSIEASNTDIREPWEWDIRAENQVAEATLADVSIEEVSVTPEVDRDTIYQIHPDADKIPDSPEYELWIKGQTTEDQDAIAAILEDGDPSDVIYVFSEFKKDLAAYWEQEYQFRQLNAQAVAQAEYQDKQRRDLEKMKSQAQARDNEQRQLQSQMLNQMAQQQPSIQVVQQPPSKRYLSFGERIEREKLIRDLSTPIKGSRGLTRSQMEALAAVNAGEPMPSRSAGSSYSVPAPASVPNNITNCDGAGCWGSNGTRYNKGAGNTYFPSTGGVCQNIGGQMQCN